jgi:hypothetical protein
MAQLILSAYATVVWIELDSISANSRTLCDPVDEMKPYLFTGCSPLARKICAETQEYRLMNYD